MKATDESTWTQVMRMERKDKRHRGCANTLTRDEVTTILATMDFFGADDTDLAQTRFDLLVPRYRVFDWLAMGVSGRIASPHALQVLVYAFLKSAGDVDAFIRDLRESDYDVDHAWEYATPDGGGR